MMTRPSGGDQKGAYIASVGVAVPPFSLSQLESGEDLLERYKSKLSSRSLTLMKKIFAHPSIRKRHFAIEDRESHRKTRQPHCIFGGQTIRRQYSMQQGRIDSR
jgi:hypothetical protein